MVKKPAYIVAVIVVVGGVTIYFPVIGQEKRIAEEIGELPAETAGSIAGVSALLGELTGPTPAPPATPVIPTCWESFGRGITEGVRVRTITEDAAGNIYIGGEFTEVDGVSASRIAMWDGTSWSALSDGLNGGPRQIAYDSIDDVMLVGGLFTNVGPLVVTWDGNEWGELGGGITSGGWVRNIFRHTDGNIYVFGSFSEAGGVSANNIAMWNGHSWSEVGGGVGVVGTEEGVTFAYSHTVTGNIYVGGEFTEVGGWNKTTGIAMWTGETWVNFGSGIDGDLEPLGLIFVHSIEYDDFRNLLYIGGRFTSVDGVPANYIASWDGHTWALLGTGTAGPGPYGGAVYGMAMGSDNRLYCGGYFQSAGGVANTRGIARWAGSEWQAVEMGCRFDNMIRWVEAHENRILVGGEADYAGEVWLGKAGQYRIDCEPVPTPTPFRFPSEDKPVTPPPIR